tara:strand:+ start:1771 stop:2517 length:747 start_codon:yes stop_codon:yes gene_type:complete
MKYLLSSLLFVLLFSACSDDTSDVYQANEIHRIPYGGTGTLAAGNYTGQGAITNVAGTTVNIEGVVIVDALGMSGKVNVPLGATLIVNDVLTVGGGANLVVRGTVVTETFTQIGNTCVTFGAIRASGKFTIGGGTTLFLTKSEIEASELVIVGNIEAITNNVTTDWYSMADLKGSKYLNRGGGTKICGPLLFNTNDDQGASGVSMSDVTTSALVIEPLVITTFDLVNPTATLYQYSDNCTPLAVGVCN